MRGMMLERSVKLFLLVSVILDYVHVRTPRHISNSINLEEMNILGVGKHLNVTLRLSYLLTRKYKDIVQYGYLSGSFSSSISSSTVDFNIDPALSDLLIELDLSKLSTRFLSIEYGFKCIAWAKRITYTVEKKQKSPQWATFSDFICSTSNQLPDGTNYLKICLISLEIAS
ncbi:hypothetical protein BDZ45DRAFT_738381 [Acephala macrosclerotiorum]|nr:hypothetical protein BDZ45DRAFT_738381 [Acephala macrosclerotiorum]